MPDPREILAAKITAAQQAKAALAQARTHGVQCTQCGGQVTLPEDLTLPQFPCRFCGTLLMTTQYVPAGYLAGLGVRQHIDALRAEGDVVAKRRDRAILIGAALLALVILVAVFVPILLARR
ncbi:MAG TPA: hypothetical protein VGG39_15720 [Polyangiaceae bacterium]|jgi:hypothetical protein